ncbi:MAG: hypothetical protein ACRC28_18830 [Clostridium sp.]|uniref:hypothetical protein n=1 Tax=Clostridium sp. TaxID=1506 RepID=UPI003F2AD9D1
MIKKIQNNAKEYSRIIEEILCISFIVDLLLILLTNFINIIANKYDWLGMVKLSEIALVVEIYIMLAIIILALIKIVFRLQKTLYRLEVKIYNKVVDYWRRIKK